MRSIALGGLVAALLIAGLVRPTHAAAHPLGNFSVNTATEIRLYADAIHVTYVVDMAEIPALQERAAIDRDGDGAFSASELDTYAASRAPELVPGLSLSRDGQTIPLVLHNQSATSIPGAAGLETLRLEIVLSVDMAAGDAAEFVFADANFEGRAGYHEVTVAGAPGVLLAESTAPLESPTDLLTDYAAVPGAAVGDRTAQFRYMPGPGTPAPPLEGGADIATGLGSAPGPFGRFLDARQVTFSTLAVMLAVALVLGAVHALEPGHGKTIVAAYFVGAHGSAWQAAALGLIVAGTHSLGVFAIAAIVLFGSRVIVPETLYPWLTLTSGLMILGLGATLLVSRSRSSDIWHRVQHGHRHSRPHHHSHAVPAATGQRPPWKGLVALGLVDGMVPTPSTLVVLLGAIATDRVELGVLLVVAFSTGMALVMAGISLAVLAANGWARRFGRRIVPEGAVSGLLLRMVVALPALAALGLLAVGSTIVVRGLGQVAAL